MKQNTKQLLVASSLLVIAALILLLSVITTLRGQIHLTSRGGPGWNVSLADNGAWFYIVPGIQAIIGLALLIGAIEMFSELRV
jgi:hypothetical protein